jgi:hypothetical protein
VSGGGGARARAYLRIFSTYITRASLPCIYACMIKTKRAAPRMSYTRRLLREDLAGNFHFSKMLFNDMRLPSVCTRANGALRAILRRISPGRRDDWPPRSSHSPRILIDFFHKYLAF